eukprot:CAMPEP_0197630544 /NCGR_PEP_ID=MMETSP1338-20131121/7991_1 /TAXON_ID=43686 ORGANISM="Pelagodinium beii, Strain RCC1491" /NCGR_SAMPLE_ID=MMETSP1338 /ASSEMBLY_ACC=CAM_ASM_000754 /LENGTH=298 /DNA_ID=CAMNT_0043201779 /DNA_START=161 /DNA_END=1054 /DNA_ORIENTATION=-
MTFTNPLDTLRCRWQVGPREQSFARFVGTVVREEGLWTGLWRPGLPPNVLAMAMAIGGRNGFYPSMRDGMGVLLGSQEKVGPRGMFVAGLLAGMTGYLFASPLLQIKTQMQVEAGKLGADGVYQTGIRAGLAPTYSGSASAVRSLALSGFNSGGILGSLQSLWRGSGVIVGRGAAVAASQLAAYDSTKTFLKTQDLVQDGPLLHVAASQVAAVACTTFSMPLDVVLTVYTSAQTLGGERKAIYGSGGPMSCAMAMLRADGPSVFFRGWLPAFLRISPTTVSSFFLYEQLRRLVGIGYL